jgi:hypothetical protein
MKFIRRQLSRILLNYTFFNIMIIIVLHSTDGYKVNKTGKVRITKHWKINEYYTFVGVCVRACARACGRVHACACM